NGGCTAFFSGALSLGEQDQKPGDSVDENGQEKQNQSQLDQSLNVQVTGRLRKLVGNDGGDRIARGEQRTADLRIITDHHGHSHRFTQGPREREKDGADNSHFRIRYHHVPGTFPARGTQGQRRLPLVSRDRQQYLP